MIAKDAKVRKLAQARQVAYVSENRIVYRNADVNGVTHPEEVRDYILKNLSDEPIYKIYFYYHDRATRLRYLSRCNVFFPGADFIYQGDDEHLPLVAFRDNSGNGWVRSLAGSIFVAANVHGRRHAHLENHLFKEMAKMSGVKSG
ncbi:hypothetical protein ACFWIX_08585 [Pseudarthrobacter sp. NPDC058362]|uniref:hypothetical protein n=1 Tax=Pseudarthrobacter sp. NPDC058362 TaxID=3346458 RepID=UPI003648509B